MDGSDGSAKAVAWQILAIGLALFLGVAIVAVAIADADAVVPGIGDIVALRRGASVPGALQPALVARRLDRNGQPGPGCLLQPDVMAASGSSLVVEATLPGARPAFAAHWAGGRTAAGADDCGSSADIAVTSGDLERLALVAGGFGVDQSQMPRGVGLASVPVAGN